MSDSKCGWKARAVIIFEHPSYVTKYGVQVYDRPWWRLWGGAKWRTLDYQTSEIAAAKVVSAQVRRDGPYKSSLMPAVPS